MSRERRKRKAVLRGRLHSFLIAPRPNPYPAFHSTSQENGPSTLLPSQPHQPPNSPTQTPTPMLSTSLLSLGLLPLLALAAPNPPSSHALQARDSPVTFGPVTVFVTPLESLDGVEIDLPQGQTQLVLPKEEKLVQLVVGRGVQPSFGLRLSLFSFVKGFDAEVAFFFVCARTTPAPLRGNMALLKPLQTCKCPEVTFPIFSRSLAQLAVKLTTLSLILGTTSLPGQTSQATNSSSLLSSSKKSLSPRRAEIQSSLPSERTFSSPGTERIRLSLSSERR